MKKSGFIFNYMVSTYRASYKRIMRVSKLIQYNFMCVVFWLVQLDDCRFQRYLLWSLPAEQNQERFVKTRWS